MIQLTLKIRKNILKVKEVVLRLSYFILQIFNIKIIVILGLTYILGGNYRRDTNILANVIIYIGIFIMLYILLTLIGRCRIGGYKSKLIKDEIKYLYKEFELNIDEAIEQQEEEFINLAEMILKQIAKLSLMDIMKRYEIVSFIVRVIGDSKSKKVKLGKTYYYVDKYRRRKKRFHVELHTLTVAIIKGMEDLGTQLYEEGRVKEAKVVWEEALEALNKFE